MVLTCYLSSFTATSMGATSLLFDNQQEVHAMVPPVFIVSLQCRESKQRGIQLCCCSATQVVVHQILVWFGTAMQGCACFQCYICEYLMFSEAVNSTGERLKLTELPLEHEHRSHNCLLAAERQPYIAVSPSGRDRRVCLTAMLTGPSSRIKNEG